MFNNNGPNDCIRVGQKVCSVFRSEMKLLTKRNETNWEDVSWLCVSSFALDRLRFVFLFFALADVWYKRCSTSREGTSIFLPSRLVPLSSNKLTLWLTKVGR